MPRLRARIRVLASGLLAVAVIAGYVPAAYAGPTSAGPPGFSVDWTPCPTAPTKQCGTMRVPVDWSKPRGEQITVAVARRPADDPAHRVGTLFFNAGGPGDGEVHYVVADDWYFSPTLRARFDIVGLDPRATGGSPQPQCDVPAFTEATTLFPRSEREFDAMRRHNRAVGESCLAKTGSLMAHTDTVSVARDHEALRVALGVKQVSWLGISYGTQLAANYAELFPRQTRAMVLDAALDHSQPEGQQVADEMMAAEDSFNRFARWCDTATECALRGQDVGAVFDRLVAAADRYPIPVEGAVRAATGEDIRMGTIRLLVLKEPAIFGPDVSWAGLSRSLAAAVAGDASAFAAAPAGVYQAGYFNRLAIGCMEYAPQIRTYAQMRQRIQMGRQLAPHLQGASETWQVNFCIDWPVPAANPHRLLDVRGVPSLIVHAVHDPSDPYRWAHSLAAQIQGAALLTRTGDGHTSYHTSECARTASDQYLLRPKAPAHRVCEG
ncbi:alpha/beta hydrolase [Phytohabitans aurantiacus]|uniref:Peptidase n=1 Tax=Phytohabitans aurantiacus TaxID=3016789 RepID=A0ABQ5R7P0_9ACTN|nr:alpha/beta hydrolase [Phytohabitans aurantiacus]GLI02182.1 peptidase [Phytohabitans aurantiacus]